MPLWITVGYQWACNECHAGSCGGFDGSKPTIKAQFERAAQQHANEDGHQTQVDKMQMVRFYPEGAKNG